MEADVAKVKETMLGNWESIAPEVRPSKNPDGSLNLAAMASATENALEALRKAKVRKVLTDVSVTVDGDTSTSDTVLLCATGQAKNAAIASADDPRLADFRRALGGVTVDLAQQLARDGEGAEKFVTIEVTGAENDGAARRIGLSIGNSPLVKTAIAAADANWGRIVMAVGKAGEKAERDRLSISVGGIKIAAEGGPVPGYREGPVSEHMNGREIHIAVDLGLGSGHATVWTCDLTHGYIDINGSYRS